MNNKNYYSNQKIIKMKTYSEIEKELLDAKLEPSVNLWVDSNGDIFWVTKKGEYIWLFRDGNPASFVDENHKEIELSQTPEGVASYGTWWENQDLEAPFHISDFITRISEITDPDLQDELISELKEDEKTPA